MVIVLDNAESILDPQGTDAPEIYAVVEELSRFDNICICITSRISITPPDYRRLDVPTLLMEAARDAFYRIYDINADRSNVVNNTLEQLDFHPLSITLLATIALQNKWDANRLAREWEQRRTNVLWTQHNKSLAATIELSLTSPLFQELGPDARALLGVIAFFPQGVDENNLEWLFPAISNRADVFDKFCILSLTYRSSGFVTMLAPLRDYLSPKDPKASPLLCATKELYFTRMSVKIDPNKPDFRESRWITSEDVNVEHLLDVFTTIDANSDGVWDACTNFIAHLAWHKKRLTILEPKIEGLPDGHRSKPECLFELSRLFSQVGNLAEHKRFLVRALGLQRERRNDCQVAVTLVGLSEANRLTGRHTEGIQQAKKALGIYERLGDTVGRADCLVKLAWLLCSDKRFNAAEEAVFRAIGLLPKGGEQSLVCQCHRALGRIYRSKGETEKAICPYEAALGIATHFDWHDELFLVHYKLAGLFRGEGRLDDAHTHIERAKLHTVNNKYNLGYATELQAQVWYEQRRFEEARSEALRAIDVYEKFGAAGDLRDCRKLLQDIQRKLNSPTTSGSSGSNCEFLRTVPLLLQALTLNPKLGD